MLDSKLFGPFLKFIQQINIIVSDVNYPNSTVLPRLTNEPCCAYVQDLHKRAWDLVGDYLASNLKIISGLAKEAESTVLPTVTSFVDEAFQDVPEVKAHDDHCVILWANLPACGVLSVHRYDWCITSISNMLAQYRKNGLALLVHPNRGQVAERTAKLKPAT